MGAALDITDLTLRFGGLTALDGVTLALHPGETLGLAGQNGSGKSSIVNVLTGHYRAKGVIRLDGQDIARCGPPDRARLGMARTFQAPRFYRRMTLYENLRAANHATRPLFESRAARREAREAIMAALSLFGLEGHAMRLPAELTPVEQRLAELARAHLTDPRLLLLDEPAAGTTVEEALLLQDALARHILPGRTVILIEHDLDLMRALCPRIAVLEAGRLLADGPADAVLARPEVRADLTGEAADV